MVSKSKILGESPIILVTIGTTNFKFDRLFKIVDDILINSKTNSLLVVQSGKSKYRWRYENTKCYEILSPKELIWLISKSERIITHAGFGTLYTVYQHSNVMPLLAPRLAEFNEHVDNHQKYFNLYLRNKVPKKYKKYFVGNNNFREIIKKYLIDRPEHNILGRFIFSDKNKLRLIRRLKQFINQL